MNLLNLLISVPIIGSLGLLAMPNTTQNDVTRVKIGALVISGIAFGLATIVWTLYDASVGGYQIVSYTSAGFAHIQLGVDSLSVYFILLTTFLTPICLLASWRNINTQVPLYFILQLLISGILTAVFTVLDAVLFYVAFETVLVPLFVMVGIWSTSPTRVRSALLLFLYTLAGSLFMLLAIMSMYTNGGTTEFMVLTSEDLAPGTQQILWIGIVLALAVKTPLVPAHIWLPRAHADAPLAGSMVLAGTVLKLATYGFLRVVIPILPDATATFTPVLISVAVVSLIYSSLATLRQVDFKALVAYSSVAHMAVVVLGLFSNTVVGIEGAIVLSLAHGLVSPALFMLVGGVLYDRYHSRAIMYYQGLAQYMPVFCTLFFIATCANMGTPLSLNWAAEFMSLAGAFSASPVAGALGASGILLSACYSIWLWGRLVAGAHGPHLGFTLDITRREVHVLAPLLILTIVFGVVPSVLLDSLHLGVTDLLYTL